jgi:hypothetical protein
MSKERELLERILVSGIFDSNLFEDWEQYIQELLAQPEPAVEERIARWHRLGYEQGKKASKREQEPINFDLERMKLAVESPVSDVTVEGLIDKVKSNRVFYQEGYAQAELDLKREPLNDLDVFTLYEEAEYIGFLAYRKGIKDAEKAHGIGGGE